MRITHEHLALQLAYDDKRIRALAALEHLTTARFEASHRETLPYGVLDLVFEADGEIAVAYGIGVDVVVLAMREGPALLWPASLAIDSSAADAIEEHVTAWLATLARGRTMAGEHIRHYRESPAFAQARERRFYGATPSIESLTAMAPFAFARRFARDRDVYINCALGPFAAAVVGTVARSVVLAACDDEFALRWFGRPQTAGDTAMPEVAVVDDWLSAYPSSVTHVVATRTHSALATVVVPVPVLTDQLFTFDAADAPAAATFGVHAVDRVERAIRTSSIPVSFGGSGGRVALVVRDDALAAGDADTDVVAELARRLRGEGLEPSIVAAGDRSVAQSDMVHIFGSVEDEHVGVAASAARAAAVPFVVTVEPLAPYATYYEDTLFAILRMAIDDVERAYYLSLFYANRLRIDGIAARIAPEEVSGHHQRFEDACTEAVSVILAPGEDVTSFSTRFPRLRPKLATNVPVLIASEAQETPVAHLLPPEPFLLLHGALTRRSSFLHVLLALTEAPFPVVVTGSVSEVDYSISLRRIANCGVIFVPDPTPAEIAAMYRRARAVVIPSLRPAGAGRLIRATLCGAIPLVPTISALARLVPDAAQFDAYSPRNTARVLDEVMRSPNPGLARDAHRLIAPLVDQEAAFSAVIGQYARASAAV